MTTAEIVRDALRHYSVACLQEVERLRLLGATDEELAPWIARYDLAGGLQVVEHRGTVAVSVRA